jgi:hypothetical protein
MGTVTIRRVLPRSREERAFIRLPLELYDGNPHYVPWFDRSMRAIIRGSHAFFEHSYGEFFLAERGGRVVGRIAMLDPMRYNEHHGRSEIRFYFPEFTNDPAVADALFAHARAWARARGGTRLVGQQGFSSFSGSGILIHGFDQTACMTMMPYHHDYYRGLVEGVGLEPWRTFHSARLVSGRHDLDQRYERAAEIAMKRGRFSIPEIRSTRELRSIAEEVRVAFNDAFADRDNFTPLTQPEIGQIVADLASVSDPSLIRILRAHDQIVGFVLAFPDLSPALVRAGGRLGLRSYLDLMREKRTTRHFVINGLGITHEFRKTGGLGLLFREITRVLKERDAIDVEMTQVDADNDLMMANVNRLGADIYKTHRVYSTEL